MSPSGLGAGPGEGGEQVEVEVLWDQAAQRRALREEARRGLTAVPKELTPRWLYDERGSLLFEEITRLPEYYPTRRERSILRQHARDIARISRAETLVELGSGFSEKTRLLLEAFRELGTLQRFVPFDVSEPTLRGALGRLLRERPELRAQGVVGDFERHLHHVADFPGRTLIAFLGGTIGNLKPAARARLLGQLAGAMKVGDTFLLGTDLLKDRGRLRAAYNDSEGVTAAFNLNVLNVLNRALEADFDPQSFEHVARFDEEHGWIEMLLRSRREQVVKVRALGLEVPFARGEALRTEVSCKFRPEQVEDELAAAGFRLLEWWTDDAGDFALTLSTVRPR